MMRRQQGHTERPDPCGVRGGAHRVITARQQGHTERPNPCGATGGAHRVIKSLRCKRRGTPSDHRAVLAQALKCRDVVTARFPVTVRVSSRPCFVRRCFGAVCLCRRRNGLLQALENAPNDWQGRSCGGRVDEALVVVVFAAADGHREGVARCRAGTRTDVLRGAAALSTHLHGRACRLRHSQTSAEQPGLCEVRVVAHVCAMA